MNDNNIKVGDEVVRTKGDYVVGRIGEVVEIAYVSRRARVDWKGEKKTWVSFDSLALTSIPYEIIPHKTDKKGRRIGWPIYKKVITN